MGEVSYRAAAAAATTAAVVAEQTSSAVVAGAAAAVAGGMSTASAMLDGTLSIARMAASGPAAGAQLAAGRNPLSKRGSARGHWWIASSLLRLRRGDGAIYQ